MEQKCRPQSKKQYRKICEAAIYYGFCYCYLCGEPIVRGQDWNLDHVVSKHDGGKSEPTNLRPTHTFCNTAKSDLSLEQFRRMQQKLSRQKGRQH